MYEKKYLLYLFKFNQKCTVKIKKTIKISPYFKKYEK